MTREQRLEKALKTLTADVREMYLGTWHDPDNNDSAEEMFGPFSFAGTREDGATDISWPNLKIDLEAAEAELKVLSPVPMAVHYLTIDRNGELTTELFTNYDDMVRARYEFVRKCWKKDAMRIDPMPVEDYEDDDGIEAAWAELLKCGFKANYTMGTQEWSYRGDQKKAK